MDGGHLYLKSVCAYSSLSICMKPIIFNSSSAWSVNTGVKALSLNWIHSGVCNRHHLSFWSSHILLEQLKDPSPTLEWGWSPGWVSIALQGTCRYNCSIDGGNNARKLNRFFGFLLFLFFFLFFQQTITTLKIIWPGNAARCTQIQLEVQQSSQDINQFLLKSPWVVWQNKLPSG